MAWLFVIQALATFLLAMRSIRLSNQERVSCELWQDIQNPAELAKSLGLSRVVVEGWFTRWWHHGWIEPLPAPAGFWSRYYQLTNDGRQYLPVRYHRWFVSTFLLYAGMNSLAYLVVPTNAF